MRQILGVKSSLAIFIVIFVQSKQPLLDTLHYVFSFCNPGDFRDDIKCPFISLVLSVLLWPLVVYHELIQRMYTGLEPILMKLDYSMKGDTEHRKHDKRSKRYCDLSLT